MRSRAFGIFAAALLLAGAPAGAAAAEPWTDGSSPRVVVESSLPAALLPADQLVAGGLGQWIWPGVVGGPYGGFALPQQAAFFGYTNASNPLYQAGVLGSTGTLSSTQQSGLNVLTGLNQTGLAPATALSLGSLTGLGVASTFATPVGATGFTIGGLGFPLLTGQTLANTSLGQFVTPSGVFQVPLGFQQLNPFLTQAGLTFLR